MPRGGYFRILMVEYCEGLGNERGIAWRCADHRPQAGFLGYGPDQATADHTTLSKARQLLDVN